MSTLIFLIQVYLLIVAIDVGLGWVQVDPARWPRRGTHLLTEPLQSLVRIVLRPDRIAGWDLSPLVVIGALGLLRVWLIQCCL